MSITVSTTAHIENGRLVIHKAGRFIQSCGQFKERTIRLTAEKETRSLAQNALLWCWNTIVGNELGWTPEEVHEFSKAEWNKVHKTFTDHNTGEMKEVEFAGDTHTMPKDAMAEYLTKYQMGWAERGISLPSPEEYYAEIGKEEAA